MFKRRSPDVRYNPQQTIKYLQWLARQLHQNNQSYFYIEFMQFDWLPVYPFRRLYPALAVALVYGLLSGLGYSISYLPYYSFSRVIIFSLLIAAFNMFLYGFFNGVVFGVLADDQRHYPKIRQKIIAILGNRVIYGILNGLLDGIFVGLIVSPVSGWICGLFSCAFSTALGKLDGEIKCAEHLSWSWPTMLRHAHKFLAGGLLVGLFYGLVTGRAYFFIPAKLLPSLFLGLGIGLIVGLIMSIRGGFTNKVPNSQKILRPNQGIRNSIRYSLLFGAFFGIAFGLLFALIYGPVLFLILGEEYRSSFPANSGMIYGLSDGFIVAAFFWLLSGGIACIQHALLRLMLWMHGSIPWNYPRFLDYCADLALLHKVGGGYIFFHRLLLEYFALLEPKLHLDRGGVEQEQTRRETTQEHQQSLTAIAHITLEDENTAFVGKTYTAFAGISQSKPDDFVGEAFEISIQHSKKPIPFDICLHASENIALTTPWHKHLLYDLRNLEPHLAEFTFQVMLSGKSYVVVDFYHERHWLRTIRFDFEAIEQAKCAEVIFGD